MVVSCKMFKMQYDVFIVLDAENSKIILLWQQGDGNVIPRITANHLEIYDESIRMIACEGPTLSNVEYFWRAVIDSDVTTIVMLKELVNENGDNIQYWPSEKGSLRIFGKVTVQLKNSYATGEYVQRHFKIARGDEQKEVTHYQIVGWTSNACPDDTITVLDIIQEIQTNFRSRDISTVMVHSSVGFGRTGTFCAIMNLISWATVDGRADVFRVVKDLGDCRPGMVQTLV
ncbi:receptor-type tyrosine-protein phosphatase alpha-like [Styela clava]